MTALALAIALQALAAGEPPAEAARAGPSRAAVRLGEPFDYAVALRHEVGERVELDALPPLGPFGVRGASCSTTAGERSAVTVCTLALQLFELGDREVPPLALRVHGPSGERRVVAPGARVRGLATTDPKTPASALRLRAPAAPPVLVPSWRLVGLLAAAAAALAAALLLWRWWRRRPAEPPAAFALPPHERFDKRVGEILALDLPGCGRGREHVQRLADAVREYLAATAPQAALDLTSRELLQALAARPAPGVDAAALSPFLAAADLVKFARHDPAPPECQAASAFARALVERTRPAPAATTALSPGGEEAA